MYQQARIKAVVKEFQIEDGFDQNGDQKFKIIKAYKPSDALSVYLKRGVSGLGKGWQLTRQPNGWILCANKGQRTLERKVVKLREVEYSRHMDQRVD